MSSGDDPEILDDIRKRAASERDERRARAAMQFAPPVVVAHWSCRNPSCKKPVEVTQDAADRWADFNAILRRQNAEPIGTHEVMICTDCRRLVSEHAAKVMAKRVDRVADAIRRLKRASKPETERELIKQLESDGHPDVTGLLESIANSRRQPGKHKPTGKGDA